MPYNPEKHHRRSIRIQGIDYALPGTYYITCVTQNRFCLLSDIVDGGTLLHPAGKVVMDVWQNLPRHFPYITTGDIVVMPNHIHAILFFGETGGTPHQSLPEVVRALKTFSARRINALQSTPGSAIWQRNYYEHIVRDNEDFCRIREYILTNPLQWALDQENPANP